MTDTQTAFVLVPREPTDEMLEASVSPRYEFLTDAHVSVLKDGFAAKYRAMLLAAPKPPESEIGPVAWRADHQIDGEYTKVFTSSEREADTWRELGLNVQALALHTPQARIDADAAEKAELLARVKELDDAVKASSRALNDLMTDYAADQCDPDQVSDARDRIYKRGTLSYIANVIASNSAALASKKETVDE